MALKPVCFKCHMFYKPKKNGYLFLEGMPKQNSAPPGLLAPGLWRPYKLWVGDQWECRGCGSVIIIGTPSQPRAEHHELGFEQLVADYKISFQVNDC